jgi:fatty-acyl-CoA synthase
LAHDDTAELVLAMVWIDLFRLRVFSFGKLFRLAIHLLRRGVQLSNVVHMAADRNAIALSDGERRLTYGELCAQPDSVCGYLFAKYQIRQGCHVLVIVDNSVTSVVLLMALSALGCNIHVMGPLKDYEQFKRTVDRTKYDFVFAGTTVPCDYFDAAGIFFVTPWWDHAIKHKPHRPFVRVRTTVGLFTSGSTQTARPSRRSNTLWQYLESMTDLIQTMRLQSYQSVLLPVPINHSYGLSTLFLSLMLNKSISLVSHFQVHEVADRIRSEQIQVLVVIPQMLYRLLSYELPSVRCIVSCADLLPATVLQAAQKKFGNIIFNLYGTTETGLVTVATPDMLARHQETIGRPIKGCEIRIITEDDNPILYVKSGIAMSRGYVRTGDIVEMNDNGWYFLRGRSDHMMVINGMNVYPHELMQMAYQHEEVLHVAVNAYEDAYGFRKLRLILQTSREALTEEEFRHWWFSRFGTKFLPSSVEITTGDQYIKLMPRN